MNRLMATTAVALTMTMGAGAFAAGNNNVSGSMEQNPPEVTDQIKAKNKADIKAGIDVQTQNENSVRTTGQAGVATMARVDIDAVCTPGGHASADISENMYLVIDTDRSGSVTTDEYVTACIQAVAYDQTLSTRARANAESNFSLLDTNRDGEISFNEYSTAAAQTDVEYERLYSMDERFGNMRANQVIGQPVYDEAGNEVAEIENVVHSDRLNRTYVVVAVGERLGAGERLVVVPVDRFQVDSDRIVYRGVSRQSVQMAPDYDPNVYLPWKPENRVDSKEDRLQNTN